MYASDMPQKACKLSCKQLPCKSIVYLIRTCSKRVLQVWMGAYESALQAATRAAAEDAAAPGAADGGAAARQVLERALKSLPKRKHVKALLR
jgi:hypothetical protein